MDALLWVGWLCTLVVLFFMILIGLFGSLALKSPRWDVEFLTLAQLDWERRGLTDRNHSMSEEVSMQRFLGQKEVDEEPDLELRSGTISTIAVLVGADDRDALRADLDERSDALLLAALSGVFNSVRNISSLNVASRVWAVRRWAALAGVLCQGLAWFLPRCFRQVARVIERYMAVATILGIAGGLLLWGFSNDMNKSSEGGIAWVNFVGIVVTVGTVVGLVLAVGQQFHLVVVSVVGPARTWTKKGIMTAVLVVGFAVGMFTLVRSDAWTQWQIEANRFVSRSLTNTPAGDWVGKILLVAILILGISRALRWARARRLKLADRITSLGAAVVLTLFGVLAALFIVDAPPEVARPAMYATLVVIVFVSLLGLVFSVVEWIGKYRALRSMGIEVRRGWFRWWALWAWGGAASVLLVLASIPPLGYVALSRTPFHLPITIAAMLITVAVMLAFWPGVVTVVRFVVCVHNAYARHEFDQASAL